jgi:hypothetical protein
MWVEIKKVPTLMLAEMWKEYFEGEGIPTHILPESGLPIGQETATYRVLVPQDRQHVVDEILRKL